MRLRNISLILLFALLFGAAFAQYLIKPTYMEVTGVSNAGKVAGYESQTGPYFIWEPETGNVQNIGGVAPGNGVGGMARFCMDGSSLSGSILVNIPINTDWQRQTLADFNFIFKDIEFPWQGGGFVGYAGGQSLTYNGNGIVIKTNDGGNSWSAMWTDEQQRGIEAMSFPSDIVGYVGGWNQYFAKTPDGGWSWTDLDPAGADDVFIYTGIAFKDEEHGVVTAQLNDGLGVYITSDGGATWTPGSGLSGVPTALTYVSGDTYYLVNTAGKLQKSIDNGLTWTNVHTFPSSILLGVRFWDDLTAYVVGETYIYKTTDGGLNWNMQVVGPDVIWHDVFWLDANNIVLCGTPDIIYESSDGGTAWTWANQATSTQNPALYSIAKGGTMLHISGSQGTFYRRSIESIGIAAEMARYDVATDLWQPLGNLGFNVDGCVSSGWAISGDGLTVVGNSWADPDNGNGTTSYCDGVAHFAWEGLIDLGSLYADQNRSTRAEAVSYDGSVVAGYQDSNGWKAAVWRKNPDGGYYPNQYLLVDPQGSATDENNQLGMAMAVSSDGNWIGGFGDWASNGEPWLWSEATGYIPLGAMPNAWNAAVTGLNYNGSIAIGYYDFGGWDPRVPFIRTADGVTHNLNDYVTQTLGYDMGGTVIYTPMDISPSGRYIAGSGFDPNAGAWGEYTAFRLELPVTDVSDDLLPPAVVSLNSFSPNPFRGQAKIGYSLSQPGDVRLGIYNLRGQLVREIFSGKRSSGDFSASWNALDASGTRVAPGIYLCKLVSGKSEATRKFVLLPGE
jgi:photosystem II stability/assembly factor-like uncharacterized protein